MEFHSLFALKYSSSEKGCQAFIRNPALPLEQNVYLYDTHPNLFFYKYAIVYSSEIILEMSFSKGEKIYSLTREKFWNITLHFRQEGRRYANNC